MSVISCNVLRSQNILACAMVIVRNASAYPEGWDKAKTYDEIPGPKPLPIIGNLWRMFIGPMARGELIEAHKQFHDQYGDIFIFKGQKALPDYVYLNNPQHIEYLLRNEGKWPIRDNFDSLTHYRNVLRHDIFGDQRGLLSSQGKEWQEIRSKVNPIFMQPRTAKQYVGAMDEVGTDFLNRIKHLAQRNNGEMPADFETEINKWAFESIGVVAIEKRLGCLDDPPNKEAEKMIEYMGEIFKMFMVLDFVPFGKLHIKFNTWYWKRFIKYLDFFTDMSLKHLNETEEKIKSSQKYQELSTHEKGVFEKLLGVDKKIAMVMTLDMFSAGIDTTGKQTSAALYYLCKYPDAQRKLREELKSVMPTADTPITSDILNNVPYLKAVIKETGRMAPIGFAHLRKVPSHLVVGGYQLPAGTTILVPTLYLSQLDKHYFKAKEFIPDRWLKTTTGELSYKNVSPFITLPFGFGVRSCVGKRFANLEMEIMIAKIVRNFELSWPHADMKFGQDLFYGIKDPLKIHMKLVAE